MHMNAFSRAFGQLPEPELRGLVIKAVLFAALVFGALVVLALWLMPTFSVSSWDWLNSFLEWLANAAVILVLMVLFPAISGLFISFFLDDIAAAVEKRHYPDDLPGNSVGMADSFKLALRFSAIMIGLNILCLPLYLFLFFIPPLNLVLFYTLNGYLLSREYFELVSARHLPVPEAARLRKANLGPLWLAGAVIAFMMTIPLLNLLAPVIATAAMMHIFKNLQVKMATTNV